MFDNCKKLTPLTEKKEHKMTSKEALQIIKEKKVDVPYIIDNPEEKDVIWYNSSFTGVLCEGWRMLSQAEYDLLREVLLNEEELPKKELEKVGQMTYLQEVLIENMNEFCSEKFDLSYERTQEEANEYINKNIEEYRSLTTHNWY